MPVKFFADIIDSLSKIFTTLKGVKQIPKNKRNEIREALRGTFLMLNSTLNMILIRLAEVYRIQDEKTFIQEVTQIQYGGTWLESERAFRLCESLKNGLREWEVLDQSLINLISLKNWKALKLELENILKDEQELAFFIVHNFQKLSDLANKDAKNVEEIKQEIQLFQNLLYNQRRKLMEVENGLFKLI